MARRDPTHLDAQAARTSQGRVSKHTLGIGLALGLLFGAMGCGPATPPAQSDPTLPGGSINDFTLPSAEHATPAGQVTLSTRLEEGPVVLVFYRGHWCVTCTDQLGLLNENIQEFEQRGASLVAVSADSPEMTEAMVNAQALGYPVLSDERLEVIDTYDVLDEDFAFPATIILLPDGSIAYREVATDPEGGHPSLDDILKALDEKKPAEE